MNTLLKVRIKVKPEFIKMIKDLISLINSEDEKDFYIWKSLSEKYDYEWLKIYAELKNADFIPFSIISEEYADWCKDKEINELKEGVWIFACELKNEENEIGEFVYNILLNINEEDENNSVIVKNKQTKESYAYSIVGRTVTMIDSMSM